MSTAFDTLTYAKKLKEAGFTEQQAEVQAEALRAVVDANLATKHDIALVQQDIALVRREIKELEAALRHQMKEMESRITLRLGGLIIAGVGALAVLMKLL